MNIEWLRLFPITIRILGLLTRLLVGPLKKRAQQWIANKVRLEMGYVEDTYVAAGKTSSPLYCAKIRLDIDNRLPEDLHVQMYCYQ